jgi:hypothetical protein
VVTEKAARHRDHGLEVGAGPQGEQLVDGATVFTVTARRIAIRIVSVARRSSPASSASSSNKAATSR